MSDEAADRGSTATSATLIGRAQASERAAWERLVELYGPLIYSWARRGGLAGEDAADLVQDVFAAVAGALPRFDPRAGGRFRGWLWTITRHKIGDHFRRVTAAPAAMGGTAHLRRLEELPEDWRDDQSEVTRREIHSLYQRGMRLIQQDFQPLTWQAFWLTVVSGKSTAEVADELGMSANSVRQARSRVLRRLRLELGAEPGEPAGS